MRKVRNTSNVRRDGDEPARKKESVKRAIYVCEVPGCGATRKTRDGIKDHHNAAHGPACGNYVCSYCSTTEIKTGSGYDRHMKSAHPNEPAMGSGLAKSMAGIESEREAVRMGLLQTVRQSKTRNRNEALLDLFRTVPGNVSPNGHLVKNASVYWVMNNGIAPMPARPPPPENSTRGGAYNGASIVSSGHSCAPETTGSSQGSLRYNPYPRNKVQAPVDHDGVGVYGPGTTGSSQGPADYQPYPTGEIQAPVDRHGVGNGGNWDYDGQFNLPGNTNHGPSEASNNMLQYDNQNGYNNQHLAMPPHFDFTNSFGPPQLPTMPAPAPDYMGYYENFAAAAADVYCNEPVASTSAPILDDGFAQQQPWQWTAEDVARFLNNVESW